MADYIPDGILSMTSGAADRLLQKGDGDAALLYLHLLRRGSFPVGKWPEARLAAARSVLAELGLVTKEAETAPLSAPEPFPPTTPPTTSGRSWRTAARFPIWRRRWSGGWAAS